MARFLGCFALLMFGGALTNSDISTIQAEGLGVEPGLSEWQNVKLGSDVETLLMRELLRSYEKIQKLELDSLRRATLQIENEKNSCTMNYEECRASLKNQTYLIRVANKHTDEVKARCRSVERAQQQEKDRATAAAVLLANVTAAHDSAIAELAARSEDLRQAQKRTFDLEHELSQQKTRWEEERLRLIAASDRALQEASTENQRCLNNITLLMVELKDYASVRTSCKHWMLAGNGSGSYYIDPDGLTNGEPPFKVFCNMTAKNGQVSTEIAVQNEGRWMLSGPAGCQGYNYGYPYYNQYSQCSTSVNVLYQGVTSGQINALKNTSGNCEQHVQWYCSNSSSLLITSFLNVSWGEQLISSSNTTTSNSSSSFSLCGDVVCNCSSGKGGWNHDDISIRSVTYLPVIKLTFKDLVNEGNQVGYSVEPLKCYQ